MSDHKDSDVFKLSVNIGPATDERLKAYMQKTGLNGDNAIDQMLDSLEEQKRIVALEIPEQIYSAIELFAKVEGETTDLWMKQALARDIEGVLDAEVKNLTWPNFVQALKKLKGEK